MKVYVAAPYEDAPHVRDLHARLRKHGVIPTSSWAETATGPETPAGKLTVDEWREIAAQNDRDVRSADVVLVLARKGAGGEMFAEARYALILERPVYWVGRSILSTWRSGVVRCRDLDEAVALLTAGPPRAA